MSRTSILSSWSIRKRKPSHAAQARSQTMLARRTGTQICWHASSLKPWSPLFARPPTLIASLITLRFNPKLAADLWISSTGMYKYACIEVWDQSRRNTCDGLNRRLKFGVLLDWKHGVELRRQIFEQKFIPWALQIWWGSLDNRHILQKFDLKACKTYLLWVIKTVLCICIISGNVMQSSLLVVLHITFAWYGNSEILRLRTEVRDLQST